MQVLLNCKNEFIAIRLFFVHLNLNYCMKKHYTLFVIVVLLCLTGVAQDEPRQPKQFYIGVFASPDLSFVNIPYPNSYFLSASNPNSNYNTSKYSYTVGLEALYQINTRLALSIGLQYSDKGGKTKLLLFPATPAPLPDHYRYSYRFFDIPLRLDYYFSRKKIAPFITTGV